jgi:two-component system alkaline phosphatase synthesis response regulator PhoP
MSAPLALIIEDVQSLADIFSLAIQAAGYETEIMPDGQVALNRLAEITPTLVLLDLNLPHVSGAEILNYIRADQRLSKIRVILATAQARLAEELSDMADLTLIKPISPEQLRTLALRLRSSAPID